MGFKNKDFQNFFFIRPTSKVRLFCSTGGSSFSYPSCRRKHFLIKFLLFVKIMCSLSLCLSLSLKKKFSSWKYQFVILIRKWGLLHLSHQPKSRKLRSPSLLSTNTQFYSPSLVIFLVTSGCLLPRNYDGLWELVAFTQNLGILQTRMDPSGTTWKWMFSIFKFGN